MNNRILPLRFRIVFLILFTTMTLYPCTTFVLHRDGKLVFGRNLDWISGTGLIIANPRNLSKTALVDPSEMPVRWISKFGSITFNQIGRELPYGGMNEAGLVIEHMTLDQTVYPLKDNRSAIGAFQWIQFLLDSYSTIEEVMSSDTLVRISDEYNKIHFLICDRFGHTATIEFLNGRMVCHTGKDLPVPALANSTYEESMNCYKNNGSTQSNPSLYHFCTVAKETDRADAFNADSTVDDAFRALQSVSQGLFTKWSIVYDITSMRIYVKVYETPIIDGERKIFTKQPPYDPPTKIVDVKEFDFNCYNGAIVLDLDCPHDNEVHRYFVKYSTEINKEFIAKAFTFFKGWGLNIEIKKEDLENLASYPETFTCTAKQ